MQMSCAMKYKPSSHFFFAMERPSCAHTHIDPVRCHAAQRCTLGYVVTHPRTVLASFSCVFNAFQCSLSSWQNSLFFAAACAIVSPM